MHRNFLTYRKIRILGLVCIQETEGFIPTERSTKNFVQFTWSNDFTKMPTIHGSDIAVASIEPCGNACRESGSTCNILIYDPVTSKCSFGDMMALVDADPGVIGEDKDVFMDLGK